MAGAEKISAATTVAMTAVAMTAGAARPEVAIQRPAPGAITVTEAPPGANLRLNFSSADAKILVQDVDVVLAFPDGGRVVLPGFAFNLVSAAGARVAFTDRTENAQELFASVSDLQLIDNLNPQTISNSADKDGGVRDEAHAPSPPPAPPPTPTPASSPARQAGVADFDKPPENPLDHSPKLPVSVHNVAPSSSGLPPTDKTSTTTSTFTSNDHGNGDGDGNVKAADLDIQLLGVTKQTVIALAGGGQDIRGAAAAPGADTDPSFNVQQRVKHIDGTAHDDVIHALDPARMPPGTFERLIDITGRLPDPGVVAETATISGLPEGFAINNATQSGDKWTIPLSKFDPNHFRIELRYVLPAEGTEPDANGILGDFTLSVMFKTHDSKGGLHLYAGTQIFVTREILSEADVTASASGVGKMYALNATPPGTEILAGDGNDTVYAGAGHDTLDGGSGANLVSYAGSLSSVMVDLLTGQGQDGSAEGDVLRNFSSIEGSAFADRLLGTAADNVFYGHGGADTIIGNGGYDVVYFDDSEEAVSVDLETGEVTGGPGAGSLLIGISDVAGSAVAGNTLIGTSGANRLTSGSGADTIDGRGGADVIAAGRGDDVVSYYATETSVDGGAGVDTLVMKGAATIDLTQADQSVGGGLLTGFEHIDASALAVGVELTGAAADNRIAGGSGADTLHGGAGRDVLTGGDGADRIDYNGLEVAIDGGDGDDTLVVRAQVNVDLRAADQTGAADPVDVRGFENVDASALGALQPVSIIGTSYDNRLTGGAGADRIDGGGGRDVIDAGGGDDTVDYHGRENSIDGGAGANTLLLDAAVIVNLAGDPSDDDQTTGDATLVRRFQNVDASALADDLSIAGDAGANRLVGGSGADSIDGGGGADVVEAREGADYVTLRGGEVSIDAGAGVDTLVLAAGSGVTRVDFSRSPIVDQTDGDSAFVANFENLDASNMSSLAVTGSVAANMLVTGAGADTIDGGGGADVIDAGGGDDTVYFRGSESEVTGGDGQDTLALLRDDSFNLANADQSTGAGVVSGFENIDASGLSAAQGVTLTGSGAANTLFGGAGNDTIDGSGGLDVIDAGAGDDVVLYRGGEAAIAGGLGDNTLTLKGLVNVDLGVAAAANQTDDADTLVTGFVHVDASGLGATQGVSITGSTRANVLTGGAGADTIDGGGGHDVIDGGDGADDIHYRGDEIGVDGGAGSNRLLIDSASDLVVNLDAVAGADQTAGDGVTVANFQNVAVTNAGASAKFTVNGSTGDNAITLGAGADTIHGAGGGDVIDAGGGDDSVDYWSSDLSVDGGAGDNTLVLRSAVSVDFGVVGASQATSGPVFVQNFRHVDASDLTTGVTLAGDARSNNLTGGEGADTIDGAGGADVITANSGADIVTFRGTEASIDGGEGTDTLKFDAANTVSVVDFSRAPGVSQTSSATQVFNFENLDAALVTTSMSVTGVAGANTISTGSGADTIHGGGGGDIVNAGLGDDLVDFTGTEASIDGGGGVNDTLVLQAVATIDLAVANDQAAFSGVTVTGFNSVDGSGLLATQSVSLSGKSSGNTLGGGAGADTIDGRGGGDVIDAGDGNDRVIYYTTDLSVDGGAGDADLLVWSAAGTTTTVNLGAADQTAGDTASVRNFESIDARVMTTGMTVMGSVGANVIRTGSGLDTIDGLGGADVIDGGDGNDHISYYGSEISISGGTGVNALILKTATNVNTAATDQTLGDFVTVNGFTNVDARLLNVGVSLTGSSIMQALYGGSGNDTIDGGGGGDDIKGGLGDDTIYWRSGGWIYDGGGGTNTLILIDQLSADLATNTATFANFQNVDGSALSVNQTLKGSTAANVIYGGGGADSLDGRGGADSIFGNAGNDTIGYYGTESVLDGGGGTGDVLVMNAGGKIDLGAGDDQTPLDGVLVTGFENVSSAATLSAALDIMGASGANTIVGGSGADTIDGLGGADSINGGAGNDLISYNGTESVIAGGLGANTLVLKTAVTVILGSVDVTSGDSVTVSGFQTIDGSGLADNLSLTGSFGNNTFKGGSGNDTIDGAGGADVIDAGAGNDTVFESGAEISIAGGSGSGDLLRMSASAAVTTVNLAAVGDQTVGDSALVTGFEGVDASARTAAMTFNGATDANVIRAGSGADTIDGLGGLDVIDAGAGNDIVSYYGSESSISGGGAGSDALILKTTATIDLSQADQTVGDTVVVTNFQNVDGSALNAGLLLTGSALDNRLTGGSGADTIDGGDGADTIDGKGGADSLSGGAGNDLVTFYGSESAVSGGSAGNDTLVLKTTATIDLSQADQTSGDNVTVTNFQNVDGSALAAGFSVTGSGLDNRLTGGSGADTIDGGSGADTIDGKGGADSIIAAGGDDYVSYYGSEFSIAGGLGVDTLKLAAIAVPIGITLSAADQITTDSVQVSGFETIDASAVTGAMTFNGTTGGETIQTGSGADTIDGNGGADAIDAGAGDDRVNYYGAESSISGGVSGNDTLVLKAAASVDLTNAIDQTSGDNVTVTKFQNVDGSGLSAAVTLKGNSAANTLRGGSDNDVIDSGGGADVIYAGAGNDTVYVYNTEGTIDGGAGTGDTLILTAIVPSCTVYLASTTDQTYGVLGNTTNFEIIDASAMTMAVNFQGTNSADLIRTGSGADSIWGFYGADTISAGDGNDLVVYFGTGGVTDGGNGTDTLYLDGASGAMSIDLTNAADQTLTDTPGANVIVTNMEWVDGSATARTLTLKGTTGGEMLYAGGAADTIDGRGGFDSIDGGAGNDTICYYGSESVISGGSAGADTLVLKTAAAVNLATTADQTTSDSVIVRNFTNIDGSALSSGLSLTGNASANTITGGSGNDTITGGGGADILSGGQGNDQFFLDASTLTTSARVYGDAGTNALGFTAASATTLNNVATLAAVLTNVQSIDFTAANVNANLSLSGAQISAIDGGAANTLRLDINAGDTISVSDAATNYTLVTSGATSSYTIYSSAAHTTVIAQLEVFMH